MGLSDYVIREHKNIKSSRAMQSELPTNPATHPPTTSISRRPAESGITPSIDVYSFFNRIFLQQSQAGVAQSVERVALIRRSTSRLRVRVPPVRPPKPIFAGKQTNISQSAQFRSCTLYTTFFALFGYTAHVTWPVVR